MPPKKVIKLKVKKITDFIPYQKELEGNEEKIQEYVNQFLTLKVGPPQKITHAFTDGSAVYTYKGNVRLVGSADTTADFGGVGVFFDNNDPRNVSEPYFLLPITNNRAELYAGIKAIENFAKFTPFEATIGKEKLVIHSDSRYMIDSITKWIHGWKKKKWKKVNGTPVLNKDLLYWMDSLLTLYGNKFEIDFEWVKAHRVGSNIPKNKESDEYTYWYGNFMADKFAVAGTNLAKRLGKTIRD